MNPEQVWGPERKENNWASGKSQIVKRWARDGRWMKEKKSQNGTGVLLFEQNLRVGSICWVEPTRMFCPNNSTPVPFLNFFSSPGVATVCLGSLKMSLNGEGRRRPQEGMRDILCTTNEHINTLLTLLNHWPTHWPTHWSTQWPPLAVWLPKN